LAYGPRSSLPAKVLAWLAGRLVHLTPPRPAGQGGTPPLPLEVRLDAVAALLLDGLSYRRAGRMVGISKTEVGDSCRGLAKCSLPAARPPSSTGDAAGWPRVASKLWGNPGHGAAKAAAALSEVSSWSVSSRAIGRSSVEWYGASPESTSGRVDAATPTLPSGTSMASKCLRWAWLMLR
jgi:hypothetical protein